MNPNEIKLLFEERSRSLAALGDAQAAQVAQITDAMVTTLRQDGAIYACGNGGSAAQAEHFVAELVGRFKMDRRPLRAFSLTQNSAVVTSIANDYGYDDVFARQIEGMGRRGDCLLGLSTSGSSENVVRAAVAARENGILVFSLTGARDGPLSGASDVSVNVDDDDTARIQELHLVIIHIICQAVERALFSTPA